MALAINRRVCLWCGAKTPNISEICDPCWSHREERYLARKAREAAQGPDPRRVEAGRKTAKLRKEKGDL